MALNNLNKSEILNALGLDTRESWVGPAAAAFGVGLLCGAAVALLLAPKSGARMREELIGKAREVIPGMQPESRVTPGHTPTI